MKNRKLVQQFLAMVSEFDENLAAVLVTVTPSHRPAGHEPVYEFHRAVMPQKQLLREQEARLRGKTSCWEVRRK